MGYTTKFEGEIRIDPPLTEDAAAALMKMIEGLQGGAGPLGGWPDWEPDKDGTVLVHNGAEKSYNQELWIQHLIEHFFKPRGYVLNGIVTAQGEEVGDIWRIVLEGNVSERQQFPFPMPKGPAHSRWITQGSRLSGEAREAYMQEVTRRIQQDMEDAADLALVTARKAADSGNLTPLEDVLGEYGLTMEDLERGTGKDFADLLEASSLGSGRGAGAELDSREWLLWSVKHNGLWWAKRSLGYTADINDAARYTYAEALAIVRRSFRGWRPEDGSPPPVTMVLDPLQ